MARMTSWREWTGAPRGAMLAALVVSAAAMTAAMFAAPLRFSPRYWRGGDGTQVERDARMAGDYYRNAGQGARHVRLRDSLRALARPGVSVRIDARMDAATAKSVERRLRLAWAAFAIDTPRVSVLLAAVAVKDKEPFGVESFAVLPGSSNEACLVVVPMRGMWTTSRNDDAMDARVARWMRDMMFGCALYARHGVPGAAVGGELRRNGWAPSALRFMDPGYFYRRGQSTLEAAFYSPPQLLPYFACAAGRVSACAELADFGMSRTRERPAFMSTRVTGRDAYVLGRSLLALLQLSLPSAEFERLWRDDRPLDVALGAITGRRLDDWLHQAVLRENRPFLSNFSPVSPIAMRALLFLLLAAVTAVALQARRTISS